MVDADALADQRVLVTGGAGFIGSHLAERLVELDATVTVLDDYAAGHPRNLAAVRDQIDLVEGDVRNENTLVPLVEAQDLVVHLAANAHVPTSVEQPRHDWTVNADATQCLLEAATDAVDRVVLTSSAAVYGTPEAVPIDESHPLDPISPYGASKLAAERLGMAYHRTYDLDVTVLRVFNTYGPRQPRYVMYDFLRKLGEDPKELEVLGSGEEKRSFAYVSDTVEAYLALATDERAVGQAVNVGGSEATRIIELAELMATRYTDGETRVYTTDQSKPGDIAVLVSDNSRLRELGVEPTVGLEYGLDELAEWFDNQH